MASALYELSAYCPAEGAAYTQVADRILGSLSSDYVMKGEGASPFLLDHSVGSFPGGTEIDVPIIYADYYYIEALIRKMELRGESTK